MKIFVGLAAACLALFAAIEPVTAGNAAREAVGLCMETLVPSLFPFFVCTNFLLASGLVGKAGKALAKPVRWVFGIGEGGAAAVPLGFISGYPGGAIVAASLYESGSISKKEAERLLAFTNNPGPVFVLGVIGEGVYGSPMIGGILLLSVVLASLVTGICMRNFGADGGKRSRKNKATRKDAMGQAISAVLRLSGFVILFSVASAFLRRVGVLQIAESLLCKIGIGEKGAKMITEGILEVSRLSSYRGALPAMAGLLSFGGISVFLQIADIARRAGLSVKGYVIGKCLSAGLAAFFCRLFAACVPFSIPTFKRMGEPAAFGTYFGAAMLLSFVTYALFYALSKRKNLLKSSCKKGGCMI